MYFNVRVSQIEMYEQPQISNCGRIRMFLGVCFSYSFCEGHSCVVNDALRGQKRWLCRFARVGRRSLPTRRMGSSVRNPFSVVLDGTRKTKCPKSELYRIFTSLGLTSRPGTAPIRCSPRSARPRARCAQGAPRLRWQDALRGRAFRRPFANG